MRITIPADAFADAAVYAAKAISNRPPNPVLSGLLIEAAGDHVRFSGFDYERSSRTSAAAQVDRPGNVLLQGRMLTDIVRKFGRKQLTVDVDGAKAKVTAGNAEFTMSTMSVDDFPAMPDLPPVAGTVDGAAFTAAIGYVAGSVSSDESLAILTAVEVTAAEGSLTLRSTDRYRLAETSIPWDGDDFHVLVKGAWLADMAKNMAGETKILTGDSTFGVRSGNRASTTLLIDGDYPKIRALFPDHTPTTVSVDRAELLDVITRVALVAERNTPVRLDIRDGEITVDAGTGEDAQGRETLPCELDGDPITVAYNPGYLTWSLATIPGDSAVLGYTTAPKPTLITPGGDDLATVRHLIMPVRL